MKKSIVLLLFPVLLLSCASLTSLLGKKPEVTLKRFDIDSISLKDVTFLFEIALSNPYPVGFRLQDVGFNVRVEGTQLLKTRTQKGMTVKAGGSEVTPVKVTIAYADIIRLIKDYTEREDLDCAIDIDIVIPLPEAIQKIKKNITFNYTVQKKIPALKPSFSIANFRVKAPTLDEIRRSLVDTGKKNLNADTVFSLLDGLISGKKTSPADVLDLTSLDVPISVSFDVEVKNSTRARLQFQDLTYDFSVNEAKILTGTTGRTVNEGSRSVIRIANTFSSKALGRSVVNFLTNRAGDYQLKGYSSVKLPDEIKTSPLRLAFDEKGRFKIQ
ncbi:MAG TPA: LEA type 2 family protein [Spirochaetota bacterium]|nr:LEA type 2 family protein [Spirochaetota bacterium]HPV41423.1 LEA type 2 family protein [Spirochaetota bacterium]